MPIFLFAVFLSAFLLFQVQPIIARYILPWYGGTPAVWTTCMLFFQGGLLLGYALAHWIASGFRRSPRIQAILFVGALLIACLWLPIAPSEKLRPDGTEAYPALDILRLLASTIAVPYVLLASSGPLLQHWFSVRFPGRSPYRLYAVSNFGSLLGLLSYPFVIEPLMGVRHQTWLWSGSFALYLVFAAACGWLVQKRKPVPEEEMEPEETPVPAPFFKKVLWVLLAALGSILLISITNQMCQDIAVVPFLWVLPLSLYLITFIISFDHARWYYRPVWIPLMLVSVGTLVYLLNQDFAADEMHIAGQISIYSMAIFTSCMVCHGEMVRLKPHPHYLTSFYLAVALGGALGGLFVSQVAPRIFDGYWELHIVLVVVFVVSFALVAYDRKRLWLRIAVPAVGAVSVAALVYYLTEHYDSLTESSIDQKRGFYGVIRVYEAGWDDPYRSLYNGRINHGRQYLEEEWRRLATTYYGPDSGVGAFFDLYPEKTKDDKREPLKVGVIGLGVGTLATFMKTGDEITFYEINPQVEDFARRHFTYLEDCYGDEHVVIGDGRVSLERELKQNGGGKFDALFIDAFSGDSIPIHLLTREAFDIYFQHLKPDGVLVVHITNLHLDLSDPVRRLAKEFDKQALLVVDDPAEEDYHLYSNDWVLVTSNKKVIGKLKEDFWYTEWDTREPRDTLWTDDFSNLLEVVDF